MCRPGSPVRPLTRPRDPSSQWEKPVDTDRHERSMVLELDPTSGARDALRVPRLAHGTRSGMAKDHATAANIRAAPTATKVLHNSCLLPLAQYSLLEQRVGELQLAGVRQCQAMETQARGSVRR